mmetsp:Transcript_78526/g.244590  ORF Transcript_78526/g.244590 Transcript_78526/m.244590 type:complete len:208 (-) Transcript_78526:1155-1778(-)
MLSAPQPPVASGVGVAAPGTRHLAAVGAAPRGTAVEFPAAPAVVVLADGTAAAAEAGAPQAAERQKSAGGGEAHSGRRGSLHQAGVPRMVRRQHRRVGSGQALRPGATSRPEDHEGGVCGVLRLRDDALQRQRQCWPLCPPRLRQGVGAVALRRRLDGRRHGPRPRHGGGQVHRGQQRPGLHPQPGARAGGGPHGLRQRLDGQRLCL